LKNLQGISLENNQITDAGLKALAEAAGEFKNLQVIYLDSTKVTKKAVDAVIQEYKIKFSIYLIPNW
jgi:Ran GTPase-activating protein (RanGAP) involved in mRNA processing and transport